jgi:hypothetical protein
VQPYPYKQEGAASAVAVKEMASSRQACVSAAAMACLEFGGHHAASDDRRARANPLSLVYIATCSHPHQAGLHLVTVVTVTCRWLSERPGAGGVT